jgi:protoporphyrin/coproporphyrin ferrochelatase
MENDIIAVLLMAYGAANSIDEIEPYLADIRSGRPTNPKLIEEVKHRYRLMGGKSPLLEITQQQAQSLEAQLNRNEKRFKVYIGMRHWHPYIKDTVDRIAKDGVQQIVALCMTPYFSKMSTGAYYKKLDEAIASAGVDFEIRRIESWNNHPLFIDAIAQKIQKTLELFPDDIRSQVPILFTAHSLPERILAEKDPYPDELHETVTLVMEKVGNNPWRFAYQSRGRTPEPWLGPEAGDVIHELSERGHRNLIMAPIGFISDHMETLYDVDVMYRQQSDARGIHFERAESLNATPLFIEAMTSVIQEHLSSS